MPLLQDNTYKHLAIFKSGHFNTIYNRLSSKFKSNYNRKRVVTPDNDFIDLDISSVNSKRVVIAIHGLEGSSQSSYILSLAYFLNSENIDVIVLNLRGCSGENNKNLKTYHSGKTDDLDFVINYIITHFNYDDINIVGYSLGGNLSLKYMGEYANKIPQQVKRTIAVSAPCHLEDSSEQLAKRSSLFYMGKFLKSLKIKAIEKIALFPNANLNREAILNSKNFLDFDNYFTSPVFGYKDAQDYWSHNSSVNFLSSINKPTLLISALDDPFLKDRCFPFSEAKKNPFFNFLPTAYGGHVGFNSTFNKHQNLWIEQCILDFINDDTTFPQ